MFRRDLQNAGRKFFFSAHGSQNERRRTRNSGCLFFNALLSCSRTTKNLKIRPEYYVRDTIFRRYGGGSGRMAGQQQPGPSEQAFNPRCPSIAPPTPDGRWLRSENKICACSPARLHACPALLPNRPLPFPPSLSSSSSSSSSPASNTSSLAAITTAAATAPRILGLLPPPSDPELRQHLWPMDFVCL